MVMYQMARRSQEGHSMLRQVTEDNLEMKRHMRQQSEKLRKQSEQLQQQSEQLQQQSEVIKQQADDIAVIKQMLQQVLAPGQGGTVLPMTTTTPARATRGTTALQVIAASPSNREGLIPVQQSAITSAIELYPENLKNRKVQELYKEWHKVPLSLAYNRLGPVKRKKRADIKKVVELFTLFAPRHVPPLPAVCINSKSPGANEWNEELEEIASTALKAYEDWYKEHKGEDAKHGASSFLKAMNDVSLQLWPDGPEEGLVDPSFSDDGKVSMRTKEQLTKSKEDGRLRNAKRQRRDVHDDDTCDD